MALSSATLSTNLQLVTPTSSAIAAVAAVAAAYKAYIAQASANSVTILGAALGAAETAMVAAMSFSAGDSASAGAAKFLAGISAFWGVMVAAPASYWAGGTVIVPPTFSGTSAAVAADFTANTSGSKTLAQSMNAVAASIHAGTLVSPTLTIPPNTWAIL